MESESTLVKIRQEQGKRGKNTRKSRVSSLFAGNTGSCWKNLHKTLLCLSSRLGPACDASALFWTDSTACLLIYSSIKALVAASAGRLRWQSLLPIPACYHCCHSSWQCDAEKLAGTEPNRGEGGGRPWLGGWRRFWWQWWCYIPGLEKNGSSWASTLSSGGEADSRQAGNASWIITSWSYYIL